MASSYAVEVMRQNRLGQRGSFEQSHHRISYSELYTDKKINDKASEHLRSLGLCPPVVSNEAILPHP